MSEASRAQQPAGSGKSRSFKVPALASLAVLIVVASSLTLISSDRAAAAGSFNPTGTLTLSNGSPGANANLIGHFEVLAPDYNFGAVINFTPEEFMVAPGADINDGDGAVFLSSEATLGLINGPCAPSGLRPEFQMMDATVDTGGATVTFEDDNDPGTTGEIFEDDNADTIPNGVQKYPDFLLRIFPGLAPHARFYGQTNVVGTDVSLNFVVFAPGTTFPRTTGDFVTDPALGYPSVTILQNLGDPDIVIEPGPITDFCTPLKSDTATCGVTQTKSAMTRDNPCPSSSGDAVRANPSTAGTYNFVTFAGSQRDGDGDGYENGFDTCPFDINKDGDPRGSADPDFDAIDSSCDPNPAAKCGPGMAGPAGDCDNDGFSNRGDNCPLIDNADQVDDLDNGDGIGDACDENPNALDGEPIIKCSVFPVNVGAAGTPAFTSDDLLCNTTTICIDANSNDECDMDEEAAIVDTDGDGVPDADDRCPGTPAGEQVDQFGCTQAQAVLDDDNDGVLNASDTCPGTAAGATVDANGCSAAQLAGNDNTDDGSGVGGSGVGALAPAVSSIPTWGALASALGGAGLLGSLGAFVSRVLRRRRE
jgi:hypothetical protein